jgi:hypothetical protein
MLKANRSASLAWTLAALAGFALAGMLVVVFIAGWWGIRAYAQLSLDRDELAQSQAQLGQQLTDLQLRHVALQNERSNLQHFSQRLWQESQELGGRHQRLSEEFASLKSQHVQLQKDYQSVASQRDLLNAQYTDLVGRYNQVSQQYTHLDAIALRPPYIYIAGREVNMWFYLTDGTLWKWHTYFTSLESDLQRGFQRRQSLPVTVGYRHYLPSKTPAPLGSDPTRMTDFTVFVDASTFSNVIPNLYYRSGNADNFLREAWHIVAQLSNYTSEWGEVPRYPSETLIAGGGDCEDTSILLASMIAAAPVNWEINLVYLDSNNLNDPQIHNHVIVHVNTGERNYLIETTSKDHMEPYPSQIVGWYLPVR